VDYYILPGREFRFCIFGHHGLPVDGTKTP
jgi:hypothetical protein